MLEAPRVTHELAHDCLGISPEFVPRVNPGGMLVGNLFGSPGVSLWSNLRDSLGGCQEVTLGITSGVAWGVLWVKALEIAQRYKFGSQRVAGEEAQELAQWLVRLGFRQRFSQGRNRGVAQGIW